MTYNEIVQNSKSKPKKFSFLCTFKVTAPTCAAVSCLETNSQRRTHLCRRPFIHYIQLLATALWKNCCIRSQWRREVFTIKMLFFSVSNSAMRDKITVKRAAAFHMIFIKTHTEISISIYFLAFECLQVVNVY